MPEAGQRARTLLDEDDLPLRDYVLIALANELPLDVESQI